MKNHFVPWLFGMATLARHVVCRRWSMAGAAANRAGTRRQSDHRSQSRTGQDAVFRPSLLFDRHGVVFLLPQRDGRRRRSPAHSIGVHGQVGGRNAPTVWNAAFNSAQFWDGRAATLEDQAKGPPTNPIEMGMKDLDATIGRIRLIPGYQPYFEATFGKGDVVTIDNAAKAIAAYERTLITPNSPYDRYVKGNKTAMTAQQVRGLETFAKVGCTACHSGPAFNGSANLPMGQGFLMKFPTFPGSEYETKYKLTADPGRYTVTLKDEDKYLWRVQTLRNLTYTAPYFHNGSVKSLDEAVRVMGKTQLNTDLSDGEVKDIVAFLGALDGQFPQQTMPRLPPTPGDLLTEN